MVVVELIAEGDVSDVSDADKAEIAKQIASAAAVAQNDVVVTVSSASIRIVCSISYASASARDAALPSLQTALRSKEAATQLLSSAGITITSAPSVDVDGQQQPSSSPSTFDGLVNLIAVVLGGCFVAIGFTVWVLIADGRKLKVVQVADCSLAIDFGSDTSLSPRPFGQVLRPWRLQRALSSPWRPRCVPLGLMLIHHQFKHRAEATFGGTTSIAWPFTVF